MHAAIKISIWSISCHPEDDYVFAQDHHCKVSIIQITIGKYLYSQQFEESIIISKIKLLLQYFNH